MYDRWYADLGFVGWASETGMIPYDGTVRRAVFAPLVDRQ